MSIMRITSNHFFRMKSGPVSISRWASSLGDHISRIIGVRPREEMSRIDTGGVIAFVANEDIVGDRSKMKDIGIAVRRDVPSVNSEVPVSVTANTSRPFPTPICFFNMLPEPNIRIREDPAFGAAFRTATLAFGVIRSEFYRTVTTCNNHFSPLKIESRYETLHTV